MFEPSQHAHFPFSLPCNGWALFALFGLIFSESNLFFISWRADIYFFRSLSVFEFAVQSLYIKFLGLWSLNCFLGFEIIGRVLVGFLG